MVITKGIEMKSGEIRLVAVGFAVALFIVASASLYASVSCNGKKGKDLALCGEARDCDGQEPDCFGTTVLQNLVFDGCEPGSQSEYCEIGTAICTETMLCTYDEEQERCVSSGQPFLDPEGEPVVSEKTDAGVVKSCTSS